MFESVCEFHFDLELCLLKLIGRMYD
jgi:hypothetical protein